jgi:hypothetical protein
MKGLYLNKPQMNNGRCCLTLAVLPICLFVLSWVFRSIKGPYYLGANIDPAYAYLLNSLGILNGYTPAHIDHPGTTLQLFGALILYGKWFITSYLGRSGPLNNSVLSDPEGYLRVINDCLILLTCLVLFWVGLRLYNVRKSLLPAITLQVTLFCFPQVLLALTNVSPEPLLVISVMLLILSLLPEISHNKNDGIQGNAPVKGIFAGGVLGFGLATKITFFPLVAIVFLLKDTKEKVLAAVCCVIGFLFFTLPIQSQYERLYNWLVALATHKGRYGHGDLGYFDKVALFENLRTLCADEPFLVVSLLLYLLAIAFIPFRDKKQISSPRKNILWLPAIACLIIMAQLFITAKHPARHYLLPSMVITALVNAHLVSWVQENGNNKAALYSAVVVFFLAGLVLNACSMRVWAKTVVRNQHEQQEMQHVLQEAHDRLIIPYYGASGLEYALAFGNDFAGGNFGKQLYKYHPSSVFYDMWMNRFYSFAGTVDRLTFLKSLRNGNTFFLMGMPLGDITSKPRAGLILKPFSQDSSVAVYRLDGFTNELSK